MKSSTMRSGSLLLAVSLALGAVGGETIVLTGEKTVREPIVLRSNMTVVLDGAHLTLAEGTFMNMFRADGVTNVTLIGRNGAVADGGVYNGLGERNAKKLGKPIYLNNTLLFTNVKGFRVEGIRFVNQRWWALNFIGCSEGVIRNLDFLSQHASVFPDGRVTDTVSRSDYEAIKVKNSDGVDIRVGCHDILIENITGFTEDDSVALTALTGGHEKAFLPPGTPPVISDITVRNVRTSSLCSNVRLLAQGGGQLHRITIDGVEDTSDGKTYLLGRGEHAVNVGDGHGYRPQNRPGDVSRLVIRNVRSRAQYGVRLRGCAENVTVENVVGFGGCPHPFADDRLFVTGAVSEAGALDRSVMSEKYWSLWNDKVQDEIDRRIETYRKADFAADGFEPGEEVEAVQLTHEFHFGAHLFNFDQLGSAAANEALKALFGPLFNSATVAFYWKTMEPYPGAIRFDGGYEDTEAYWNGQKDPTHRPHWRRPAPGPVIAFCRERGLRIHGHPLVWGNGAHYPAWIFDRYCPQREKEALFGFEGIPHRDFRESVFGSNAAYYDAWKLACNDLYRRADERQIAALAPTYVANLRRLFEKRIRDIAERYGDVVDSWDVVNESAYDFDETGRRAVTGLPVTRSGYGLLPGDYAYRAFKDAEKYLPKAARLNINDYSFRPSYTNQIAQLRAAGAKIDVLGTQMHIFDPKGSALIAAGENVHDQIPAKLDERFAFYNGTGLPIHLSEITITAPGTDRRSEMIQAIITRNLYRYWFSVKNMDGITWWNTVDGCGALGEPSISGLLRRDLTPKTALWALGDLVNGEWKTRLVAKADARGRIRFRGFKGKYRLTRRCRCGERHVRVYTLGADGATAEAPRPVFHRLRPKAVTVDGRSVEPDDRGVVDLAAIYPKNAEKNVIGTRTAEVRATFAVAKGGCRTLYYSNDWFGEVWVNGKLVKAGLEGPSLASFGELPVETVPGENEILFKTRSGSSGQWYVRLALEADATAGRD